MITEELLKLSGMAYHADKHYSHWQEITGIDPRKVWGIKVWESGRCSLTDKGRAAINKHFAAVRNNWHALGISA